MGPIVEGSARKASCPVLAGMRTVLEGRAGAEHASAVASLVLRGLGVVPAEADEIARRPLPPLAAPDADLASGGVRPRRGRTIR